MDDPVADEEWMEQYEENMRANEIIQDEMLKRLHGTTKLNESRNFVYTILYTIRYNFNKHIYVKDYFMAWQGHSHI